MEWTRFRVKLQFRDKVLAGLPSDPKALRAAMAAREAPPEVVAEVADSLEDAPETDGCVFRRDEDGIWVRSSQVKAAIKECCSRLGLTLSVRGLRQHLQHGVFVRPERLRFVGKTQPDGEEVRAGNPMTARGPRSVLRWYEYVERGVLEFELWVAPTAGSVGKRGVADALANIETWRDIWALAAENGLGAARSQGYGTFDVLELATA